MQDTKIVEALNAINKTLIEILIQMEARRWDRETGHFTVEDKLRPEVLKRLGMSDGQPE